MFHLGTVVSKPIFSSRSSNSIHKLWRISFGLALLIGQQTHRCLSLHGSPCQLVALPTSGWSVVNQYVRNWPINHDVTLQAFTSSFKGNRTFHFAICFFVIPDENFADWCSGNVRWPHDLRYVPLRFYVHVFYMFFLRGFLSPWNCGRFQCHNFQMGRKKMNVLLLHSFAPEAFLQVPLPANLPRLLDDGERARKAGKAAKSLDLFLDCSKTQQLFMRQIMADIKLTTCKKITRILIIYIYIHIFVSKKACTSSAVFRYPINRNPCHWRPEFCTRQAEARAELKDFCPVTLVETGKLVKAWRGFTLQEVRYHCVKKSKEANGNAPKLKPFRKMWIAGGCLTRFRCWFLADLEARRPRRSTS